MHWRIPAATALLLVLMQAGPAAAQRLPGYVAGPVSGLAYDCRQAGQAVPDPRQMVASADLDGDGEPDHVVDAGRGCAANRLLYCSDAGCSVDVYLSSTAGLAGSLRARRVRLAKGRLELVTDGPACGRPAGQDCTEHLEWDGAAFLRRAAD